MERARLNNSMGGHMFRPRNAELNIHSMPESELRMWLGKMKVGVSHGRHIGILASLKFLCHENTTPQILALLDHKEGSVWKGYPHYVFNHFFDCLRYRSSDGCKGDIEDREKTKEFYLEAKKFLDDALLDEEKRTQMIEAYSRRWYDPYSFQTKGPEEEGATQSFLDLFSVLEHIWKICNLEEKIVYLDLLLLKGNLESLQKIISLTKNEKSVTVLEVRAEALFYLYRDFPLSFHEDDPDYFWRKIQEIAQKQRSGRIDFIRDLSDLIKNMLLQDPEQIDDSTLSQIGVIGAAMAKRLGVGKYGQPTTYGDYSSKMRVFPIERAKEIWSPTFHRMVNWFDSLDEKELSEGIIKDLPSIMNALNRQTPKRYLELFSNSSDKEVRRRAVNGISDKIENVELLKIFSKDTDRVVRSIVVGKLVSMREVRSNKWVNTLRKRNSMEEIQSIDKALLQMSKNRATKPYEKKRILVALGQDTYDF